MEDIIEVIKIAIIINDAIRIYGRSYIILNQDNMGINLIINEFGIQGSIQLKDLIKSWGGKLILWNGGAKYRKTGL